MTRDAWQPIETAPRDGTRVLVWSWSTEQCEIVAAHSSAFWNWIADDGVSIVATHWRPLPAPPKGAADD